MVDPTGEVLGGGGEEPTDKQVLEIIAMRRRLQEQLEQQGVKPDTAEINRIYYQDGTWQSGWRTIDEIFDDTLQYSVDNGLDFEAVVDVEEIDETLSTFPSSELPKYDPAEGIEIVGLDELEETEEEGYNYR